MNKIRFAIPLILFVGIIVLLWKGLSLHPAQVPSPLVNKPAPALELPDLLNSKKVVSRSDLTGHVTLLNVWATWCYACLQEHAFLVHLSQDDHIQIVGLDYKDDSTKAKKWLNEYGNPFQKIAVDKTGMAAIDWGVYGTPETFVIDKKGIIRYKHIGPINADNWQETLKPIVTKLEQEIV